MCQNNSLIHFFSVSLPELVYHRIDVLPTNKMCLHLKQLATTGKFNLTLPYKLIHTDEMIAYPKGSLVLPKQYQISVSVPCFYFSKQYRP